jgi:hypothetical protein
MRVAAGQFIVTPVWQTNAHTCVAMMQQAAREGVHHRHTSVRIRLPYWRDDKLPCRYPHVFLPSGYESAGQFIVTPVWQTNAHTCVAMMQQAAREGAALLV